MPSIDDYRDLIEENYEDKLHVKLQGAGVAVVGPVGRVTSFLSGSASEQNRASLQALSDTLTTAFGEGPAKAAMDRSGLQEKLNSPSPGPLTIHRLAEAVKTAETLAADIALHGNLCCARPGSPKKVKDAKV